MAQTFDLSVLFKMVDRFSSPLKQSMHNFNKWNEKVKQSSSVAKEFGENLTRIGRSATMYLTAPLAVAAGMAVKTAVSFESAFTGVIKTVDATAEELAVLKTELMKLPSEIPLRQEEIFGIAEAAGQLGIMTPKIAAFTKVMADLGVTTNLGAREGATQLARFANITAMSQDDFQKLGSTIVGLGNNLATTEAEIVAMAMRLAGTGTLVGMNKAEIMGFAAALSSVGIEAQMGGTAFSQVMTRINKEIGSGSDKMAAFAKISGMSVTKFEKMWKEDAAQGLMAFVEGLKKLNDRGVNVSQVLDSLQFDGFRVADSLLRAAGSGDKLREAIDMGNKFWKENNALTKEATLRYGTMGSQFSVVWNEVRALASSFGDVLAPAILKVVNLLKPIIQSFKDMDPAAKGTILVIAGIVAAVGPLLLLLGALSGAIALIATVSVPVILTIAGISAAFITMGAAVVMILNHLDEIKEFFNLIPEKINQFASAVEAMALSVYDNIADMIPDFVLNWLNKGEGQSIMDQARTSQLAQANTNNSKADINIKVSSDQGSSAQVQGVTKKGDANVNVINDAYLGMGGAF